MKGAELPINTLIIIVIALTILLAVIAIFFGVFNKAKPGVDLETAKSNACQMYNSIQCYTNPKDFAVSNFDADKDGIVGTAEATNPWAWNIAECGTTNDKKDTLGALCSCYYGINIDTDCKTKVCNCPET